MDAAAATWVPDPLITAAGDIACDPADSSFNGGLGTATDCRQKYTSDKLLELGPVAVLPLGDAQYECGGYNAFLQSYDPSWGRLKPITRPAIGNHEYMVSGGSDCDTTGLASGYFDYFGSAAGERDKGYYSYDIGSWHLIALNSNCSEVGCTTGSQQEQWLLQDLAANPRTCTLAYWHHPFFSSGHYSPGIKDVKPLFRALYAYNADVLLVGHDHMYERFAPQNHNGKLDLSRGIRQFIVGTGGASLRETFTPIANSEKRNNDTFGILKLRLRPTSYKWTFVAEGSGTFRDEGDDTCDGTAPDTSAPSAPTGLIGSSVASNVVDLSWTAADDQVGVIAYEIYRNGNLLVTTPGRTSYSDGTVAPGTSYSYQIKARDAAGNLSGPSNSVTVTTQANTTIAFLPEADARVEQANPSMNFGSSDLRVDHGDGVRIKSYLRFNVTGPSTSVKSAKLRLYAYNGTGDGPVVYGAANTWTETGITWDTRAARISASVDDRGVIEADSWVEYDVSSLVAANGAYSFDLATVSTDAVHFYSREAASLRPVLVVTY